MGDRIRVLVLDDHVMVAEGLAALLQGPGGLDVVGVGHSVADGVAMVPRIRPDVLLTDHRMKDGTSGTLLRALKDQGWHPPTAVLSTDDGLCTIREALEAGARSFLLKDMPLQQVLEAVRRLHDGGRFIPPAIAERAAEAMALEALTTRELEVLDQLAQGSSNSQIGATLGIGVGTVKVHVNNVMMKLNAGSRTEAVVRATRFGLVRLSSSEM
jgi:DNA-binding NarL/FixJ family response regulator